MTLKDKFLELLKDYNPAFKNTESKGCEKIAEEFAIGYARFMLGDDAWRADDETLEIYKKTL